MSTATVTTSGDQVDRSNATGLTPVVFIHGLWLLPSSWDRWATLFEEAGYAPLTPGWPDDPETVEEANAHPEVFAGKTVGQVADHFAGVIGRLSKQPAVIGHSFGALPPQITAGRRRAAADHLRREGPHGAVGHRQRLLQEAAAQRRRHGDHDGARPRARAHRRQRLAGGRRQGAGVRQAVRLGAQQRSTITVVDLMT